MKSNKTQSSELILQVEQGRHDMYFIYENRKCKKITLDGYEEEVFYVSDDPNPETLGAWIEFSILDNMVETEGAFEISCKWNGLTRKEEEGVVLLINQTRSALKAGTSLTINLNSIFSLSEWAIRAD
ncbi:MAG: hypothetical protein AB1607_13940 [Chloroflexota bacterium]